MKLWFTNKHGKVVLNEKTINSLTENARANAALCTLNEEAQSAVSAVLSSAYPVHGSASEANRLCTLIIYIAPT